MSEIKYKYLAIMEIGDTPDFPSALVRRTLCDDPHIHMYERCNRITDWVEDRNAVKWFMGMADEGYVISEEHAEKILVKYRERWENPRFDEDML